MIVGEEMRKTTTYRPWRRGKNRAEAKAVQIMKDREKSKNLDLLHDTVHDAAMREKNSS